MASNMELETPGFIGKEAGLHISIPNRKKTFSK